MKIVTLIENLVYQKGLVAEHGLSVYIENGKKILFDTGQSGAFICNANVLGIDISDIDALVISHGHYDHTGGLYHFLEKNSKAKVFAKKGIFGPKYHGRDRFIGTPYDESKLKGRLVFVDSITEIDREIFIMPDIKIYHAIDTHHSKLNIKKNDKITADEFEDELFIALKQKGKVNILTACSHRGITNICQTAHDHFKLPVGLILGGFHLKDCSAGQFKHVVDFFRQLQPESVSTCHCTGADKYADLRHLLNIPVHYNYTGNIIDPD